MSSPFLSSEEKQRGIKHHFRHQFLNGLGFNFLGDTPVSLLAIYFGATNTQLGYLSAVIYASGLLLSITPKLLSGRNIAHVQYMAWLIRGLICIAYIALFFIDGRPAVLLIILSYTLFCGVRIVGASVYQPIIKMISTKRTRGEVLSASSMRFQVATAVSKFVSFVVTSLKQLPGVSGILFLSFAGIVLNTLAAFEIRKIPCREKIYYKKGRNIFSIFIESVKNRNLRVLLFLSFINAAIIVLCGFIIPFLRLDAHFSDSEIFLVTIAAAIGTILSAYFTKSFADRLGSRPLLIGVIVLLSVSSLLWVFSGFISFKPVFYIFMFLLTFFLRANDLLIGRLMVNNLPEKDSVGFSSMMNFFIAIIALSAGFTGGRLADLSGSPGIIDFRNNYVYTFMLVFVFCILSLVLTWRVNEKNSLSPGEAASIIFSPSRLTTYLNIGRLYSTENPMQRKTILLSIGMDNSRMATEEIRTILASPLSSDKGEMITSLFSNPRQALLPEITAIASEPDSYHQLKAIFALGAYPGESTEETLLKLLDSPDPAVVSNAAKSLGRIGHTGELERIRKIADEPAGIWDKLNFIIALKNMDHEGKYLSEVFNKDRLNSGSVYNQTIYSLYADVLDFQPPLADIFQSGNIEKGSELRDFLDESREEEAFYKNHREFLEWFKSEDFENIWSKCRYIAEGIEADIYYEYLKQSIINFPPDKSSYDDALAAVYFTYQLLKMS